MFASDIQCVSTGGSAIGKSHNHGKNNCHTTGKEQSPRCRVEIDDGDSKVDQGDAYRQEPKRSEEQAYPFPHARESLRLLPIIRREECARHEMDQSEGSEYPHDAEQMLTYAHSSSP